MIFPDGKKFAFSIFDDTDMATLDNVGSMYEFLLNLKIHTTKSVWVLPADKSENSASQGQTLSDPEYLAFILKLRDEGFEIGFHGPKGGSSNRSEVVETLKTFKNLIGDYPRTYANHLDNRECLYWGVDRLDSPFLRFFYKLSTFKRKEKFLGHVPNSEYFWGDIAQEHITYVRNFVYPDINTFKINPSMPYHDPLRPYVNFWFSSSDGCNVDTFNRLLNEENQRRLESEGGVCIVYTHFANGFVKDGKVNPVTVSLLNGLSKREGWFVPVSMLLDYLREQRASNLCPVSEKRKMEYFWFISKMIHGSS